jgi:uncharacterized membrane protein
VNFIPDVGTIIGAFLQIGFFIAGTHAIRGGQFAFRWTYLFHGILLFFPVIVISILYSLLVCVGLFLLILPGLYFMVAYSFSIPIYIEYRQEGLGILQAMEVSRKLLTKHFWSIVLFYICQVLIAIAGVLALGVGVIVSIPVALLMTAFAFRDIVGLSEARTLDNTCVCC